MPVKTLTIESAKGLGSVVSLARKMHPKWELLSANVITFKGKKISKAHKLYRVKWRRK